MPIQPTEKIWRNGQLIPWEQANIHVMSHVIHYGSSVFEGIRCYGQPSGAAIFGAARAYAAADRLRHDLQYGPALLDGRAVRGGGRRGREQRRRPVLHPLIALRGCSRNRRQPDPARRSMSSSPTSRGASMWQAATALDVYISNWNTSGSPTPCPALAKAGASYTGTRSLIRMEADIERLLPRRSIRAGRERAGFRGLKGENVFLGAQWRAVHAAAGQFEALSGITRDSVLTIARHLGLPVVRAVCSTRAAVHRRRGLLLPERRRRFSPIRSIDRILIGDGTPDR